VVVVWWWCCVGVGKHGKFILWCERFCSFFVLVVVVLLSCSFVVVLL